MKNWTGNSSTINGVKRREDAEIKAYYATDPKVVEMLLELENFNKSIGEPACGESHISKVLEKSGHDVIWPLIVSF